jgi:hypothetical protein
MTSFMNLACIEVQISLLYFFEFFTLEEQELWRIYWMKDVVLYESVPTKFVSPFLELYFIFYEFSILRNKLVQKGKEKLTGGGTAP